MTSKCVVFSIDEGTDVMVKVEVVVELSRGVIVAVSKQGYIRFTDFRWSRETTMELYIGET